MNPPTDPKEESIDPALKLLFDTVDEEKTPVETPSPTAGASLSDVVDQLSAEPAKPEEKKEEEKKSDEPKPDDKKGDEKKDEPKPEEKKEEFKPIRARREEKKAETPPPPTPEPPKEEKKEEPKAEDDDLIEEERERLKLLEFAEQRFPEKYKGLATKTRAFFKAHKAKLEEMRQASDDGTVDMEDPAYQAWLAKNQPKLSAAEERSIEREFITEQATARSREEVAKVKHEVFRDREEPVVRKQGDQAYVEIINEALPQEVRDLIKKDGAAKAGERYGIELEVAEEVAQAATTDIEEFIRLTTKNPENGMPLKAYDGNNPQHVRILELVNRQCDDFKRNGGKLLVRDGRQFLTREEYFRLPQDKRDGYWTFSNSDMVKIAKLSAAQAIKGRVKAEYEKLERLGFKRAAAPAADAPPPPSPSPAPAPRPSPAPGGDAPPSSDPHNKLMGVLMGD